MNYKRIQKEIHTKHLKPFFQTTGIIFWKTKPLLIKLKNMILKTTLQSFNTDTRSQFFSLNNLFIIST